MKTLKPIRRFYRPIQPTVKMGEGDIHYQEYLPDERLIDYIYCYWQLKTKKELASPFIYQVVSDACIDIFFNRQNLQESFVMGFCRKYTEFAIGTQFDYAGIRFFPSVFPLLFGISAKVLSNQDQFLAPLVPQVAQFIGAELNCDFPTSLCKWDEFFLNYQEGKALHLDERFYQALLLILKHRGHLETENGLDTGLSPRQLRRIFNYYIGTTPKTFSQVVRFQSILRAKPSAQSLKENKIFYDAGFYDQAHFIKEFRKFYGLSPNRALR